MTRRMTCRSKLVQHWGNLETNWTAADRVWMAVDCVCLVRCKWFSYEPQEQIIRLAKREASAITRRYAKQVWKKKKTLTKKEWRAADKPFSRRAKDSIRLRTVQRRTMKRRYPGEKKKNGRNKFQNHGLANFIKFRHYAVFWYINNNNSNLFFMLNLKLKWLICCACVCVCANACNATAWQATPTARTSDDETAPFPGELCNQNIGHRTLTIIVQ